MKARSKTPLFFMEIIIMLLVFSLAAAICLQVFAGAKKISTESHNLDKACTVAQEAAEYWQGTKGDLEKITAELEGVLSENQVIVTYDRNWNYDGDTFLLCLTALTEETAKITVLNEDKVLLSLETKAVMYGE